MRTAGFDTNDAVTFAHIKLVHAVGSAQAEANVRNADYLEPQPNERRGRRYRVKPGVLREDLRPEIRLATSYAPDQQHKIMTEIIVGGLHARLTQRQRPSQ